MVHSFTLNVKQLIMDPIDMNYEEIWIFLAYIVHECFEILSNIQISENIMIYFFINKSKCVEMELTL